MGLRGAAKFKPACVNSYEIYLAWKFCRYRIRERSATNLTLYHLDLEDVDQVIASFEAEI